MHYHALNISDVFKALNSSRKGLTEAEAKARLEKYGLNEIKEKKPISAFKIFLSQFASPIIWILLGAIIISLIIKEQTDAVVIAAIVILNAVFGFVQEFKAGKAIEALKRMAGLKATVIRDGEEKEIRAEELVPGDILVLETGDKIAADARLIESVNLQTQEAALTGESLPVKKELTILDESIGVADRKNMVFSGTIVTKGRAKAIVTATGMQTELGKIASLIEQAKPEPTPLQKNLKNLAKFLGLFVIIIAIVVFIAGIIRKEATVMDMLLVSVALAVAAIPEGLPAVVTISLALGVQRMVKRNALIRKLPSVETLGACTVICTDKTGTLTHNEMTVRKLYVNKEVIEVTGSGYDSVGKFSKDPKDFELLLKIGALNNDAKLRKEGNEWLVIGDPTEAALLVSAKKAGIDIEDLQEKYPRKQEIQFSSERKRMTTIHKINKSLFAFTKGAPDIIINLCDRILINGRVRKLTKHDKRAILEQNEKFARKALRVLGFAYKKIKGTESEEEIESNMIFVGLQAMIDPPRKGVKEAIAKCKKAGIKVVMITGDYEGTARAIAEEIGIRGKSLTGAELDRIHNLEDIVEDIAIYARVDPGHKTKIIDALRKRGHTIAMTGDGVNDAPALKMADIGIAMGVTGTDVAKEASEMILTDDNFVSIVNAVEEGRSIYDNIRKFVFYLLSSNMGEILTLFIAILIGLPLPLIALQILWINLLTDGLPALALSVDPAAPDIMVRPPRKVKEKIMSKERIIMMIFVGLVMMVGTLGIFKYYKPSLNLEYARTMAFTTLMFFQMWNVLNARSEKSSLFKIGIFTNKYLIGAMLVSIILQFIVLYTPLNVMFHTLAITAVDWIYVIAVSASVFIFYEIIKIIKKR